MFHEFNRSNPWFHFTIYCPILSPRHRFFEDIHEIRAEERARNNAKLMEVMERRQRQMEELAEKRAGGSD